VGCELGFLGISVASDVDFFRGRYGESYKRGQAFGWHHYKNCTYTYLYLKIIQS